MTLARLTTLAYHLASVAEVFIFRLCACILLLFVVILIFFFFFFQAEDGIRDLIVTGVQTCALPIYSSGLGNRRVTAILVVDDGSGDRSCRQTAQAATGVGALPQLSTPKRFDEFPSIAFDDDKARLDQMAVALQNSPGSTRYIIAYAGRRSRAGEAERMGKRAVAYLTVNRGISRARLIFVNGGLRDADAFELWLVPQGAEPPRPTPTVTPNQLRPAPPARRHD